jgi:glycogen synthase
VRVLLVSQEVPPETGWGGIGTYVEVLSEALAAKGHQVDVLSVVEGQARKVTESEGVTVYRFPLPRVRGPGRVGPETWRRAWLPAVVARLVAQLPHRPTVVECPEWRAEGLALGLRRSLPLVVRLHSSARQLFRYTGQGRGLGGLDGRVAAWLEEASARRAHVVISTRSNLDETVQLTGIDPATAHAIPYPVRLPDYAPPEAHGPPRVLFVGRLEPRKGPEVLVRAAPRVLEAVPDTRFVFVGRDGVEPGAPSSAGWLQSEAARLGVERAMDLIGPRDLAGVAEEMRRATVCAFPSRWESFGNVVAEASAVGRPVVASDIPPFRELVGHASTGSLVPSHDPEAWAEAICAVLGDRARAQAMGLAGARRVNHISDPGLVGELTLDAYAHALERARERRRAGSRQPRTKAARRGERVVRRR